MTWTHVWQGEVAADWIDELGHVGFLRYQQLADLASLEIWRRAKGLRPNMLEFVMTETHVRYISELRLGMPVQVVTALLAFDSKRFLLLHEIRSSDKTMCTVETLNLCFDPESRKAANFTPEIAEAFAAWPSPPDNVIPRLSIVRAK